MSIPQWIVIGGKDCRRTAYKVAALQKRSCVIAHQIDYLDLIFKRVRLQDLVHESSIVSIDSMLESIDLRHAVMELGRIDAEAEGAPVASRQEMQFEREQGNFSHPLWGRQMYWGMTRLLNLLQQGCNPNAYWASSLQDIVVLYDKYRCQNELQRLGIPVPKIFAQPTSFEEVREIAKTHPRLMLKTSHGSGGAGCIAIHANHPRFRAFTPLQYLQSGPTEWLYCCKSIRCITEELELARMVDRLCQEKCHVEAWLPKASIGNERFDFRAVTIGGEVTHQVARLSKGPMTNLNLGNRRMQMDALHRQLPWYKTEVEPSLLAACESASKAFPNMATLGIDVLVRPDRSIAILELNAFGGLLPGTEKQGMSTYDCEIDFVLQSWQAHLGQRQGASCA